MKSVDFSLKQRISLPGFVWMALGPAYYYKSCAVSHRSYNL